MLWASKLEVICAIGLVGLAPVSDQYMNTIKSGSGWGGVRGGGGGDNYSPPYARYDPEYEQVNECIRGATVLAK